ncbi:MAG: hypothetical protein V7K98_01300 [Nostoc sp.]|uniref:hypothetical protein n=1 Tax=Nostoc sp. TaxID=1180 RepID=UPI002FF4485E
MKAKNLTSLITALIWGCQSSPSVSCSPFSLPSQVTRTELPMISQKPVNFITGPAIKPSAQLLDWLNQEANTASGSKRRLRLPVFIHFEDSYRLAIGDSFIGVSDVDRHNNPIFLSLDDTSMGVSLLTKVRDICPNSASSCGVWLEGYWGALIDFNLPGLSDLREEKAKKWPFTVLEVHGLITKQVGDNHEIKIFIESPGL